MIERGIHTTLADFWIHLHPCDEPAWVYWYSVLTMRRWIQLTKPAEHIGRSKDSSRTESGRGYLISKNSPIIDSSYVPPCFVNWFVWDKGTDRENGLYGELVIIALIEQGIITLHRKVSLSNSSKEQYSGIDGSVEWHKPSTWEAKTETYISNNLFIQTREKFHKPTFTRDGRERPTNLPGLDT